MHLNSNELGEYEQEINTMDKQTIALDVKRSVAHWDVHKKLSIVERERRRSQLQTLIEATIRTVPHVRYYQGIHDVCLVILELCDGDVEIGLVILRPLLLTHFAQLTTDDFRHSLLPLLDAVGVIVRRFDSHLADIIEDSAGGYHFTVPWILTWFSHSLEKFGDILLVFDYLVSSKSSYSVLYLCSAIILEARMSILTNKDDPSSVFRTAQRSIHNVNLSKAMQRARGLSSEFPPVMLRKFQPNIGTDYACDPLTGFTTSLLSSVTPVFVGLMVSAISVLTVWNNRESILDESNILNLFRLA